MNRKAVWDKNPVWDVKKNINIVFTEHATYRWNERCYDLETSLIEEFKNATENKSILNNTNFMMILYEKYGTNLVAIFYTTKDTVFVCKQLTAGLIICVTLYPTNRVIFKEKLHFKKKEAKIAKIAQSSRKGWHGLPPIDNGFYIDDEVIVKRTNCEVKAPVPMKVESLLTNFRVSGLVATSHGSGKPNLRVIGLGRYPSDRKAEQLMDSIVFQQTIVRRIHEKKLNERQQITALYISSSNKTAAEPFVVDLEMTPFHDGAFVGLNLEWVK